MKQERDFLVYVVQIPDQYTIIINYGKDDNEPLLFVEEDPVRVGDTIKIIQPGKEIIDTKTEKLLGYYDLIKAKLEIVEMYENFSVCKIVKRENVSTMSRVLSPMFVEKTEISYEKLQVSESEIVGTDKLVKEIHIGDPVIFD